jgi:hypothetical protein
MIASSDTVITRASTEWWKRPVDERYLTLDGLYHATFLRAHQSRAHTLTSDTLYARGSETAGGSLYLEHEEIGALMPTDWSLGQIATVSHTPAKWLRELAKVPAGPAFAAHALNLGLRHLAGREKVQLMSRVKETPGERRLELRCLVGPDYGRIYDHQVVDAVRRVNEDGRWHIPAASYQAKNPVRATTLYASDRDVFIFLVDERNPVCVKVDGIERHLFRGFMVWNSEVGHHRFGFMTFLYDFVCDNRTVWGAREVKELSIRHTKNAPDRFAREVQPLLKAYTEASVIDVEAKLERATRTTLGSSDEEVLSWLRSHDFTKREGERIIETAKAEEGGAKTAWEIANGLTGYAKTIPHADERVRMERRVSTILNVAA